MEQNHPSTARVVTDAGETTDDASPKHLSMMDDEDDEDDSKLRFTTPDELFDENLDDQDEAYVYKHLRSGVPENVRVRFKENVQQLSAYKPRSSDAVLSCPCCFNIVCMDCQRHERYAEQYRAMFVMGIVVKWDQRLVVSPKGLVPALPLATNRTDGNAPDSIVGQEQADDQAQNEPVYYAVCCANCDTVVASLDMTEEVYHFYGCLASS